MTEAPSTVPVFTYGTLLDPELMLALAPGAERGEAAWLCSHELRYRAGLPTLEPGLGNARGGLWLVPDDELHSLERYEGAPELYRREEVEVVTLGGLRHLRAVVTRALTYLPTSLILNHDLTPPQPLVYLHLNRGYEAWDLFTSHLHELRQMTA